MATIKKLLTVLAVICVLSSCVEDEVSTISVPSLDFCSFRTSVEQDAETKVHFETSGSIKWDVGDAIMVYSDLHHEAGKYVRGDDNLFEGDRLSGNKFFSFSPSNGTQDPDNHHIIRVPALEVAFNREKVRIPMVAKSEDNNLAFKQTCGVLHFVITGIDPKYSKIVLRGNNSEAICGQGTLDMSSDITVLTLSGSDASDSFAAALPKGLKIEDVVHAYFVLPPMDLEKGFTLTLQELSEDGTRIVSSQSKSTGKAVSILRSRMIRYDWNLVEPEEEQDDEDDPSINYYVPKDPVRVGPDFNAIDISSLGIFATKDGRQLDPRPFVISTWIVPVGDKYLGVQGNTGMNVRRQYVRVRFYEGSQVVFRKSFIVEQEAVSMSLVFETNKDKHYYFRDFNTQGLNYLFYTPYAGSEEFSVNCNYPELLFYAAISLPHTGQEASLWADDGVVPAIAQDVKNETVTYTVSYPSNRNYSESYIGPGDIYYTGLARESAIIVRPRVVVVDNWTTFENHYENIVDGNGKVQEAIVLFAQAGIQLYDNRKWGHICYPISDPDTPYYSRADALDNDNNLCSWDYFCSNVVWDPKEMRMSDSSWAGPVVKNEESQNLGNYQVSKFNMYVWENPAVTIRRAALKDGEPFRNGSDIPIRESVLSAKVDLHDGKDPIYWPVMRLYQLGVPKISFNPDRCYMSDWAKGNYYDAYGNVYPYMANLYFDVDVSRDLASDFDAFQYYHFGKWNNVSLTSSSTYSVPIVASRDDVAVSGTEDLRLLFPNGSMVYASEPFEYEYTSLPHLTSSGVGAIQINMNIYSIPSQVPGFYDRLTTEEVEVTGEGGYDDICTVLRAWLGEEKMIDIYFNDTTVYKIDVLSRRLTTIHGLSLNSTAREIFAVGAEVQTYDDWTYATYSDGVHFFGLSFTAAGWSKLEQVFVDGIDRTFTIEDMQPDSTPSNIEIWLEAPKPTHD